MSEGHGVAAVSKHFPVGSIMVDAALILGLVFSWGQLTQTLKDIDNRVSRLEAQQQQPSREIDERFGAIEATIQRQDKERAENKADIVDRLSRIEAKLDKIK